LTADAASPRADGRRRRKPWPYAGEPLVPPDPGPGECACKRLDRLRAEVPHMLAAALQPIHAADRKVATETLIRIRASSRGDLVDAQDLGPAIRRQEIRNADGTVLREPSAVPAEWRDPSDTDPHRRTARKIAASRATDPLHDLQRSRYITRRHSRAARRWLDDYERSQVSIGSTVERIGMAVGAPGADGMYCSETVLIRLSRWKAACAAVGKLGVTAMAHVILGWPDPLHRDVKSFARRHHLGRRRKDGSTEIDERVALGILVAALDRLADFYDPPAPGGMSE
jgi:hypothetical protein